MLVNQALPWVQNTHGRATSSAVAVAQNSYPHFYPFAIFWPPCHSMANG